MLIDEMPAGREMDNLVAEKVMGLVHSCDGDPKAIGCPYNVLPMYSTNIAAAWEVVLKMKDILQERRTAENGWPSYRIEVTYDVALMSWWAKFDGLQTYGSNAAHAICRAALKALSK